MPRAEPEAVSEVTLSGPVPVTAARAELNAALTLRSNGPVPEAELDWESPSLCAETKAEPPWDQQTLCADAMPSAGFRSNSVIAIIRQRDGGEAGRLDRRDREGDELLQEGC